MRLLVLGGTKFLGRHAVDAALAAGHEVTLFTRGQTNPELFPEAEHLQGHRDGGLGPLEGRSWDGVLDTSGFVPRVVRQSAELLRDSVERELLERTRTEIGSDANLIWTDEQNILDADVQPWTELPLWLPGDDHAGMARADISRALAAGLEFRPLEETVADTLAWDRTVPGERPTLRPETEQEILARA
jgi:nucleoside-diphosphate-sugar epimerase